MLEIVLDNRSGVKMEIVVPTINEAARIARLAAYYGPRFDLVVLDEDSKDGTGARAIEAGASVLNRTIKGLSPEAHLACYVNTLTKSGKVFWLFADEFVPLDQMVEIEAALESEEAVVLCRRVNYIFGRESLTLKSVSPRGFTPGSVTYSPENLHDSLKVSPGWPVHPAVFDVHHLHLYSTRTYFGTVGSYAYLEVEQFRKLGRPKAYWRFFRRFVVTLGAFLLARSWREKRLLRGAALVLSLERVVTLLLAAMSWVEQAYLPTIEQQKAEYSKFFDRQ